MPLRGLLPLPEDNVARIEVRRIRRARFSRHSLLLRAFVPPWFLPSPSRSGFTLIEVMIAAAILGVSLGVLLTAASRCLLVLSVATHYQDAQLARSMAEVEYPLIVTNELDDIAVPQMTLDNGMTFERVVDEDDEDEDNLYVVTTRVGWSARGAERVDEVVQYVYHDEDDDD
ncbi:MAG: prepilin-type N-terminal cleavage/methylation domain-containing protein [Kiritimatiellia bacterium]|nr:prepilin-type N-terminal cleavage/methylation domain-containing protein [Kiritimatiellia bacterium]MDP6810871.1 prepilin-type N-terminal cleavage/methylation domain-containing protein [Kiritimatiellia bacterium]MDP7024214.1 prepilin-type N-terminal cleavage/methylation domain-containing protein [Kiritimatiellia bacterium]